MNLKETYLSLKEVANTHFDKLSFFKFISLVCDINFCSYFYKIKTEEYFFFELYKKNKKQRKSFVGSYYEEIIWDNLHNDTFHDLFRKKHLFNTRYNDLLKRDWLYPSESSFEDFQLFCKKHPSFISKIDDGYGGTGVQLINTNKTNLNKLFKQLKKENRLIEELVIQCNEFSSLHPQSVNTIRVLTSNLANDLKVYAAFLRIGSNGSLIDNLSISGLCAPIDVETGTVITDALNFIGKKIPFHPNTNVEIKGFKIPKWNEIVKTAIETAKQTPGLKIIGFDFTINSNNEIVVIEANDKPGILGQQMGKEYGSKQLFNKITGGKIS